jgi:hypothetical protein
VSLDATAEALLSAESNPSSVSARDRARATKMTIPPENSSRTSRGMSVTRYTGGTSITRGGTYLTTRKVAVSFRFGMYPSTEVPF